MKFLSFLFGILPKTSVQLSASKFLATKMVYENYVAMSLRLNIGYKSQEPEYSRELHQG